jgi:hypothetical protein
MMSHAQKGSKPLVISTASLTFGKRSPKDDGMI